MNKNKLIYFSLCLLLITLLFSTIVMAEIDINVDQDNNVVKIMNDINIPSDMVVNGDVIAINGDIRVDGIVKGDVIAILGDIRINNVVEGDLISVLGTVYRGTEAMIEGETTEISIGRFNTKNITVLYKIFDWNFKFFKLILLFGLSILIFSLMPVKQKNMAQALEKEFLRKLLIGVISVLLLPVIIFLFVLTVIGIPLIPLILLTIVIVKFIGYVAVVFLVGSKIADIGKNEINVYLKILFGVLILWLLNSIPVIGIIFYLLVTFLALGVIIDSKFGTNNPWFKRKIVADGAESSDVPVENEIENVPEEDSSEASETKENNNNGIEENESKNTED